MSQFGDDRKLGIDIGCVLCYVMRNMLSITVMHNMHCVFF
jgi:hypothetical protein